MINRTLIRAATAAFALVLPATAHAQYPTSPPEAMPMRQLQLPPFENFELPNGLKVVLVRDASLPTVIISVSMPAGSANDPVGQEGLASIVSDVMLKGTATRTAEHIAAEIEGVGASLNAGAGTDFFTLGTAVLKDDARLAFELVGDVLINATYPDDEIALAQQRFASSSRVNESSPAFLAGKFFSAALYGESHPYGRTADASTFENITPADVRAFANSYLRPGGSVMVLAGDLTVEEARSLSQEFLGDWEGRATVVERPTPATAGATEIILVNRPGSAQSNILFGNLTMHPGDEDYYSAVVANRILGGGGDARLFRILREDKGWTYGAYSSHNRPLGTARFQANTEVRTEVTDSALTEMLHQINLMRTQEVPDEELQAARGFLLGSFPLQIQTAQQVAGQVRTVLQLGLGDDYLSTYRTNLAEVGKDQITRVSQRIMRPDSAVIVVVGDGAEIYDGLAAIAPVRIIDTDGRTLARADLNPPAVAVEWVPSRITSRRDSFNIMVQGQNFGYFLLDYAHSPDGSTIEANRAMIIPGLLEQRSTLVADAATLAARSFTNSATQQGQTQNADVTYANGRVTGTTTGQDGEEVAVDMDLEPHVIEANTLSMFTGALNLSDGLEFVADAYETTLNAVGPRTVEVSDGGEVTVPAGAFDTWLVEIQGQNAFEYYVSKSTGVIVKLIIVGQPLSFELVATTEN